MQVADPPRDMDGSKNKRFKEMQPMRGFGFGYTRMKKQNYFVDDDDNNDNDILHYFQ